jgi:hypothetical protein
LKVLFDVNVPRRLRGLLLDDEVSTAQEEGWATLENGELLRAAEQAGFDVMITADQNIAYQQNLSLRNIAIIVLPTNDWSVLKYAGHEISAVIHAAKIKNFQILKIPRPSPPDA